GRRCKPAAGRALARPSRSRRRRLAACGPDGRQRAHLADRGPRPSAAGGHAMKPKDANFPGRFLMQVLWPSFLVAIVAEGVFFSMIDPEELALAGVDLAGSRQAAYTVGFLVFWFLFSLSSALTWLLTLGTGR